MAVKRSARSTIQSLLHYSRCSHRYLTTTAAQAFSRPSIAPKPTIDIKSIRQRPELYAQNCLERDYKPLVQHSQRIVQLFEEWKALQNQSRGLRERSNYLRTKLSHTKTFSGREVADQAEPSDKEQVIEEARLLREKTRAIEEQEQLLTSEINELAIELPNLTSSKTPVGKEPKLIGYINEHLEAATKDRVWRSHVLLGAELDLLDFASASTTTGWGWYYLKNEAALLEQALIQYALKVALQNGFSVVTPPSVVYSHISSACGFRPRDQGGEQQVYAIQHNSTSHKPEHSLAGTAEIPFAAMKANTDLEEGDLPLRVVGPSRCYRAEAGSYGADTKGLYRVHEFTKVEMFGWTMPDGSENDLFHKMVGIQSEILESLGLRCRILEQPSTDLGASATRKQDIEAFFPSRGDRNDGWGEVTSASICTDYQTRRLGTRVRSTPSGKMAFPYTVNGTAMAVPRVLAAILENHWDDRESCIRIPEVLWPWMAGVHVIRRQKK